MESLNRKKYQYFNKYWFSKLKSRIKNNIIGYLIYKNKHTKIILTDINELLIYLDGI